MTSIITSIGLDAPGGVHRTISNPVIEDIKQAIAQIDGVHVTDLLLEVEQGERYLTLQCNSNKQCICSIQDGESVYMLKSPHPLPDTPFPDYPPEYTILLEEAVVACREYADTGTAATELVWDKL